MTTELKVADVQDGAVIDHDDMIVAGYYKEGAKERGLRCACDYNDEEGDYRVIFDYGAMEMSHGEIVEKIGAGRLKLTVEGADEKFDRLTVDQDWSGEDLIVEFSDRYFTVEAHAIKIILEIVP